MSNRNKEVNTNNATNAKKVVIVGAGPAGLTAAYELLKRDKKYKITILEESNTTGGISRTVNYNGNRMDIGGHRFFSKDERVMNWWKNTMPIQGAPSYDDKELSRDMPIIEGGPDPETENRVMLIRHRVSRIYYKKKFFDYPVTLKMQTLANMGLLKTTEAGFSYLKAVIFKKQENNLENFYINRFGKVLYSMFFEGYTKKLWGRHPREISADWGAQRVKGLSVKAVLKDMISKFTNTKDVKVETKNTKVETSLIEEFLYPKYGPGQLWETVADEIKSMGAEIIMNARVNKIICEDNKVKAVEYIQPKQNTPTTPQNKSITQQNKSITQQNKSTAQYDKPTTQYGDVFISSMPLKDLIISMGDIVPEEERNIATGLPYRDFVTVGVLVRKLNLKNETNIKTLNNIIPDCWIYVQDTGVKLGRIQIFNNWSPYMVESPEKTVWIGLEYFCNEGDYFWEMSDKECRDFAIKELIKMDVISDEKVVLATHREKVKKAYPAYFDTYQYIDKLINYINTYNNLYCVGRNGQHRYNNMDHSMVTSFEAVDNIISGKKDKSNIWSVNTEKEYHEEKHE